MSMAQKEVVFCVIILLFSHEAAVVLDSKLQVKDVRTLGTFVSRLRQFCLPVHCVQVFRRDNKIAVVPSIVCLCHHV